MKTKLTICLTAVLALMSAPAASGENVFVDGTVWEMLSYPDYPPFQPSPFQYKLDGVCEIGGYQAMKMFENHEFVAFVRTDGDKVFFAKDEENPEWLLCFDFGMQPGDECLCYNMIGYPNEGMLMRCVAETTSAKYGDRPALDMLMVAEEEVYNEEDTWFLGVGSSWGPVYSCWAGLVGIGFEIQRVTNGDRVIFEKEGSGISAPSAERTSDMVSYYNLQGMKIDNPSNGVFIRVDSGKTSKELLK